MCKRTAWTVTQLHLCACVCVCVYLLHPGQFLLLLTHSKLRLKVQELKGQSKLRLVVGMHYVSEGPPKDRGTNTGVCVRSAQS